jgi:hypothetical protein
MLLKLGLQSRPGDVNASILIEGSNALVKLRLLRGCQRRLVVILAIAAVAHLASPAASDT